MTTAEYVSQSLLHQGIFVTFAAAGAAWPRQDCLNPFFIRESLSPIELADTIIRVLESQSLLHQGIFVTTDGRQQNSNHQ